MDLIRTMEAEFKRIKANREWSVEYMTLYMKYEEQRREGYDQGREEERAAYAEERAAYRSRIAELEARLASQGINKS